MVETERSVPRVSFRSGGTECAAANAVLTLRLVAFFAMFDNQADMRDVIATVVDLAVRGYIEITETTTDRRVGRFRRATTSWRCCSANSGRG